MFRGFGVYVFGLWSFLIVNAIPNAKSKGALADPGYFNR